MSREKRMDSAGPIVVLIILVLYIIPSVIGMLRGHHNKAAIIAVNLLLGWTFIGWVVAFVWSVTATRKLE